MRSHRGECIDRLSDTIAVRILSDLPTKEAVAASILSKRWRKLWTRTSSLDFDLRALPRGKLDAVFSALLWHRGSPITKFRLLLEEFIRYRHLVALDQWLYLAMRKQVEEMCLDLYVNKLECSEVYIYAHAHTYDLPKALWGSQFLRVLSLKDCNLNCNVIELPSLVTLQLTCVSTPEGQLQISCVQLKNAHLRCCHTIERVEIYAPMLRSFDYRGDLSQPSNLLFRASSGDLAYYNISCCSRLRNQVDNNFANRVRNFMQNFSHVKHLSVTCKEGKDLTMARDLSQDLPPTLPRLKRLDLNGNLHDTRDLSAIVIFLKNSPHLEIFTLTLVPRGKKQGQVYGESAQFLNGKERELEKVKIECLRHHTKLIKIEVLQGYMIENMLIKFLLSNAMILEKLHVNAGHKPFSQQLKEEEKFSNWRANTHTKIEYH